MDIKKVTKALTDIRSEFSMDTTPYQAEKGVLIWTGQATFLNSMCSGISFGIKMRDGFIHSQVDKLKLAQESNNTSDKHDEYKQGLISQIDLSETQQHDAENLFNLCKTDYKKITDEVWKPYVKSDENSVGKKLVTATNLEANDILNRYNVDYKNDALKQACEKIEDVDLNNDVANKPQTS